MGNNSTPVSSLDFLELYLGIDKQKAHEYIQRGKFNQLRRIAIKLYFRYHKQNAQPPERNTP